MQKVPHHLNRRCHGNRRDLAAARRRPAEQGTLRKQQIAFPPPLPPTELPGKYATTSSHPGPGAPGYTRFLRALNAQPHSSRETELALQWALYDFGRTGGRYRQAVAREGITD